MAPISEYKFKDWRVIASEMSAPMTAGGIARTMISGER
jgi:hypothetical protein